MPDPPANAPQPDPYRPAGSSSIEQSEFAPIDIESSSPRGISEDWLAVILGGAILGLVLMVTWLFGAPSSSAALVSPLKGFVGSPGEWESNPMEALARWPSIFGGWIVLVVIGVVGAACLGRRVGDYLPGLLFTLVLATLAYFLANQLTVKYYNLEYALWALLAGLLISNTVGTPQWMRSALMTEFYIKTGLVLLGAEIIFGQLVALGLPGICVSWVVTPAVLITTFWFGQKVLKIESPTLNMVISADMSVCGVSAAIATAAACRAKKEELSLAIGLSLSFTVVMMVVLPAIIRAVGMSDVVGGAWLGGTIDSTGAVAAAGGMLGETALSVATTIKMIQNILIGVIAFGVAAYWVRYREAEEREGSQVGIGEIWRRFPRFILGFVAASIVFSMIAADLFADPEVAAASTSVTKTIRGWLFCLAFVCIGLETNFAELSRFMKGGKPLVLYVVGQSLNLCLTLLMSWLAFVKWFPEISRAIEQATR